VHVIVPEPGPLADRLSGAATVHVCNHILWATAQPTWLKRAKCVVYNTFVAAPRIARIARRINADVVMSNTITTVGGALGALLARLPHVWFVHEYGREDHGLSFVLGDRLTFALMRNLMRVCVVNSEVLHTRFREEFAGLDVHVVPLAVDAPAYTNGHQAGAQLRLVLVGAKTPSKGQHEAIASLAALTRRGCDAHLELVGRNENGHERQLMQLSEELGVSERVSFIEFDPNPAARFHKADVVLMCSRAEAFGRTTIEGMKAGKPVVGAAAGATPELIRHGWNGYLYPPGDTDELTKWLEACDEDRAGIAEMGRRGQEWARGTFNQERYGAGLEAALSSAVSERPGHRNEGLL
jgi:glycosyltransferase involved in cell wall biosynthesis